MSSAKRRLHSFRAAPTVMPVHSRFMSSTRSLIKMENRTGDMMQPCLRPMLMLYVSESVLSTCTELRTSLYISCRMQIIFDETFILASLYQRPFCHTISYAFHTSANTTHNG